MSLKIGIITHYYNSTNYGGNLQAYALCKFLEMHGYEAEQISYDKSGERFLTSKMRISVCHKIASKLKNLPNRLRNRKIKDQILIRSRKILTFNQESIPHSSKVYSRNSIPAANEIYDVFITGSDQVWHPKAVCGAYLLDFADASKKKLSYAASLSVDHLPAEYSAAYSQALSSFDAVSVREQDAVPLVQTLSSVPVRWVLDPVFLLTREQWSQFGKKRKREKPYVFCYFLGHDPKHRDLANAYANARRMEVVTMPYLSGKFHICDQGFGNLQIFEADPTDFVSLIRNADCIFTDSFHVTAFSVIFEKQFFVFGRSGFPAMGSRICSILSLVNANDRFFPDTSRLSNTDLLTEKEITWDNSKLKDMIKASSDFLLRSAQLP